MRGYGRRRNFRGDRYRYRQTRLNRQNYYLYNNEIDHFEITETNKAYNTVLENSQYGLDYEHSIVTKSCSHLDIHSINETKVYTNEYKKFFGLKLVLIKNEKYNLIPDLLDKGKFKVIPFSNKYYELKHPNYYHIFISINKKHLDIKKQCKYDKPFFFDNKTKYNYHKSSMTSKNDEYLGKIQLFNRDKRSFIDIFLYSSICQIDGLFNTEKDIDISDFKIRKSYSNFESDTIKANSLIVYEIKSGNREKDLVSQMSERGHFIGKYLNLIYNKPIYYIGFYRNKHSNKEPNINGKIEANEHNIGHDNEIKKQDVKDNEDKKEEDIKIEDKKEEDKKEEDTKIEDKKEEDKKEEDKKI